MTTTLSEKFQSNIRQLDIKDVVEAASHVIHPYGPITAFAARDPWAGMERQPFVEAARRIKAMNNVDILPNDTMLQAACNRGAINIDHLKAQLEDWLDEQCLDIPEEVQEQFCWNQLLQENKSLQQPLKNHIKNAAKKLKHLSSEIIESGHVQTVSQQLQSLGLDEVLETLNFHMIKWCKLFLDEGQAVWAMPHREEGFYKAWRKLVLLDPALNRGIRKELAHTPIEADEALNQALHDLNIPQAQIQTYLEAHLLTLPGWAGMLLWHDEHSADNDSLLMDYLAIRLSMELALVQPYLPIQEQAEDDDELIEAMVTSWAVWGGMTVNEWAHLSFTEQKARLVLAYRFDSVQQHLLWLEAWEKTYEDHLKKSVTSKSGSENQTQIALAQFAFCLDVRSEPLRRLLEKAGPFETFGTAGFFGLPIETCKLEHHHSHSALPVMLQPQFKVNESLTETELKEYDQRLSAQGSAGLTFETMKHNLLSSLLLPEISGPWLTLQNLASSFIPRSATNVFQKLREKWRSKPNTRLTLDHKETDGGELPVGFTEAEKVHYARQALEMMGLTENFAPLVVICGHESESLNNPHATALDCSACGGASSEFNARVLAALCNIPNVRQELAKVGLVIPEDTVFVAAKHCTTIDELEWVFVPELSDQAEAAYQQVQVALPKVAEELAAERMPELPNVGLKWASPKAKALHRAKDWSEIRPEWGLARNAAFIIGGRELTKASNLESRVFLHNYNWRNDRFGDILMNIIKGPVTVAQWINMQYYASTVAPHYYGSGNKMTQTVTSGIGVMQGNASDLLTGLPWQSVMQSDQTIYHDPLRLLTIIQAPDDYIQRIFDHNPDFQQKVDNGWIRLSSIDPDGNWKDWA